MTESLGRIGRVAVTELVSAVRSRRALVVTLLFVVVAAFVMYGTISAFAALEREVLSGLGLPGSDAPGSVTTVLWKSKPFLRTIDRIVGDSLVFADIRGRHPIALAYAMFLFQVVPLLTLLVSAPRVAEDLRSGAARYWLVRVSRNEWSLGKFVGEAMLLACAMLVGCLAAWTVVLARLPGMAGVGVLPELVDWTLRAWVYAFGWLGLFLGVSHISRSGGKATALAILALLGVVAWGPCLHACVPESGPFVCLTQLECLAPSSAQAALWRRQAGPIFHGLVHLTAVSLFYLSLGAAVFRRRDV